MNLQVIPATLVAAFFLSACSGSQTEQATSDSAPETTEAAADGVERAYYFDAEASKVNWRGTMLGVKSHHGQVSIKDGKLAVKDGIVIAGHFTVDLSTIRPTDEDDFDYAPDGADGGTKSHLIGHLKSDDFFDVENHPIATLNILESQGNSAVGEFTLRGITGKEVVEDIVLNEKDGKLTATGKLTFDRQKYDVSWSSGMADAVLSDKIEIDVELVGNAPAM